MASSASALLVPPSEQQIVSAAIDSWDSLSKIPVLSSARISNIPESNDEPVAVELLFRQASLSRGSNIFHTQSVAIAQNGQLVFRSPTVEQLRGHILGRVDHEKSNRTAVFIAHERSKDSSSSTTLTKVMLVEIWDRNGLLASYELQNREGKAIHGRVHRLNSSFGGAAWSPDGSKLVYSAEREAPTSEDWQRHRFRTSNVTVKDSEESKAPPGMKYEYVDTWGEQLNGSVQTRLFVLDLALGFIDELKGIDDNLACSEPQWSANGQTVVFVGTNVTAHTRRFGIVYCTNRPSQLYSVSVSIHEGTEKAAQLLSTSSLGGVRSPRFTPDGRSLVFLDVSSMATHRSCDRLVSLPCFLDNDSNSKFGEPSIIIDTVESPTPDEFPGIYCQALPERPWLHDNQLLLSSYVRSNITALTVDLSKKSVTPFTLALPPTEATVSGFEVLDVHKSFVLLEQTKFNEPPIVFLIRIDQQVQQVSWTTRLNSHTTSKQATELAKTMNVARRQFTATDGSEDTYEGFHLSNIGSVGSTDRTLMVVPHGGPHSCFSPYWGVSLMTFFLSGFDLLLVNYRGSTGFGKRYIDDLAGRCGSMDVNDVYEAIRATREAKYQNVVLHGGSHGGFLVGHLVGQFPDLAVAACLRNPVTNIASMTSSTDIRDWAFVESNGIESFASSMGPQTAEQNEAMFKKSPIAHAHKIKTPCLILIGSNDLRVPSYQGREFHFVLKGRGIPTRLLEYSDNHTLSDVPHDFDGAINAIQWFVKNINRTV